MLMTAFYIILMLLYVVILGAIPTYAVSILFSWIKGAPYVPTQQKELENILKTAQLKENQYLLELGCGDGRVLRTAAKIYNVKGKGIDINPVLIFWAKIKTKLQHNKDITFNVEDIHTTYMSKADVIYIFLFPKLVESIKNKLLKETKPGVQIISHGFRIPFLEQFLTQTITGTRFETYYYQLHK